MRTVEDEEIEDPEYRAWLAERRQTDGPNSSFGRMRTAAVTEVCCRMSQWDRYCSLIPGFGVKLSVIILAGPTGLCAVGTCPPHDGEDDAGGSMWEARFALG
jgi:hypothetical protein